MAGDWIKFEVNTPEKQEVLAITVAMGWDDPDLTVGKLLRVWRWFDQQTVDGNAPSVSAALLDRIAGVSGFALAMANVGWLVINESGVSLPNFGRHNGKTAKDRALTAKRVANHKANGACNGAGNAPSVSAALPREREEKEKKKTPLPPKGGNEEPEGFAEAWDAYPKREGGDSRKDAAKAWKARIAQGATKEEMLAGVKRYAAFVMAKKKVGTEFVKRASTFFGPGGHYLEPYGGDPPDDGWWRKAGFETETAAINDGCTQFTYTQFENGQRRAA